MNIDVPELEPAIAFYSSVFELKLTRRLGDGWAELTDGPFVVDLLRKPAGTLPFKSATTAREYHRHWTPVHLDFCVEDIHATVERARAAGATVEQEITERPFGKLALLSDPFGHGLCVLQLTEGDYDRLPGVTRH